MLLSEAEQASLEIAADVQGDVLRIQSNVRAGLTFDAAVYVLVRPQTSVGMLIAALNAILAGIEREDIRAKMAEGQATWAMPAEVVDLFEPKSAPATDDAD